MNLIVKDINKLLLMKWVNNYKNSTRFLLFTFYFTCFILVIKMVLYLFTSVFCIVCRSNFQLFSVKVWNNGIFLLYVFQQSLFLLKVYAWSLNWNYVGKYVLDWGHTSVRITLVVMDVTMLIVALCCQKYCQKRINGR